MSIDELAARPRRAPRSDSHLSRFTRRILRASGSRIVHIEWGKRHARNQYNESDRDARPIRRSHA